MSSLAGGGGGEGAGRGCSRTTALAVETGHHVGTTLRSTAHENVEIICCFIVHRSMVKKIVPHCLRFCNGKDGSRRQAGVSE